MRDDSSTGEQSVPRTSRYAIIKGSSYLVRCAFDANLANLNSEERPKPPPEKLGTAIYGLFKPLGGAKLDSPRGFGFRVPSWAIWDWPDEEDASDYC